MRLILVRHGETQWNSERKIQGATDICLNDQGVEQAEKLALSLRNEKIDAIVTSPLIRAHKTAQMIGEYHEVPIQVANGLRELNVGELEGMNSTDMRLRFPHIIDRWTRDRASVVLPGGESLADVERRAWPVIEEIIKQSENALVVSHNFVIAVILCKIQNLSLAHSADYRLNVASKTCVEICSDRCSVLQFNDTCHLR